MHLHVLLSGGSGTDSSDISGVPKSSKHPSKIPGSITDSTDYGYVTWESRTQSQQEQENQEQNSSSSNDDDVRRNPVPRTNPVKPRAKNNVSNESPAEKKEKRRLRLLKRSKERPSIFHFLGAAVAAAPVLVEAPPFKDDA